MWNGVKGWSTVLTRYSSKIQGCTLMVHMIFFKLFAHRNRFTYVVCIFDKMFCWIDQFDGGRYTLSSIVINAPHLDFSQIFCSLYFGCTPIKKFTGQGVRNWTFFYQMIIFQMNLIHYINKSRLHIWLARRSLRVLFPVI